MNRVEAAFEEQRRKERRSLIPFVVGGHPSMPAMEAVLPCLARAGARIIEIGVPFSDPIADGPVISEAMRRAIEGGATPQRLFEVIAAQRTRIEAAIVFMVSASIVERMGREHFITTARRSGVDGLIIPDLDLDEAPAVAARCRAEGLVLPMLVAPATGPARMRHIVECSSGFIYLLARQGVTGVAGPRNAASGSAPGSSTAAAANGMASEGASSLRQRVQQLRSISDLPIACGFGISTAAQVAEVLEHADAAIVGSALVAATDACDSPQAAAATATSLMQTLLPGELTRLRQ